jgi:hypothetical protein
LGVVWLFGCLVVWLFGCLVMYVAIQLMSTFDFLFSIYLFIIVTIQMRFVLTLIAFATICLVMVQGHAKLNTPTAWNPNPSKTANCGGVTTAPTVAAATLILGQPWTFQWQIVAGDGAGPVAFSLSTSNNATAFAGSPFFTSASISATQQVNAITLPATSTTATALGGFTSCTGTGGLCAIRLKSSSDWYACTTVKILASAPPSTTPAPSPAPGPSPSGSTVTVPTCVIASGLSVCSAVNGKSVLILPGSTGTAAEFKAKETDIVQNAITLNMANPFVFETPSTPGCIESYTRLLCAKTFMACPVPAAATGPTTTTMDKVPTSPVVCTNSCVNTVHYCGITSSHANLYSCNTDPAFSQPKSDSLGTCVTALNYLSIGGTVVGSAYGIYISAVVPMLILLSATALAVF